MDFGNNDRGRLDFRTLLTQVGAMDPLAPGAPKPPATDPANEPPIVVVPDKPKEETVPFVNVEMEQEEQTVQAEPRPFLAEAKEPPATPAGVPSWMTDEGALSGGFKDALDSEIERLMQRTRRLVRPPAAPAPPPAPVSPPEFEMPQEPPPRPVEKKDTIDFPVAGDDVEEGIDRQGVLGEMERAARKIEPWETTEERPRFTIERGADSPFRNPARESTTEPPIGLSEPQGWSIPDFSKPAARPPKPGKVRNTARRVGRALAPLLSSALGPANPWLTLGVIMIAILWMAAASAFSRPALALVGAALLAPLFIAALFDRRPT